MSVYVETGEEEIDPSISCASCEACCCRLEVMLMGDDDVPARLTVQDQWGGWVMRRLDDLWCVALDRITMRCTIYEIRPGVCRDYQAGASECIGERSRLLVQLRNERVERGGHLDSFQAAGPVAKT
jgi:Fe-S-cluster containining protein